MFADALSMMPALVLLLVVLASLTLLVVVVRPPSAPWGKHARVAALAVLLGLWAYILVNPLLALLSFGGTCVGGFLIAPLVRTGRLQLYTVLPAAAQAFLPVGLFLVLNYMRPDLMQVMLDHVFGYVVVLLVNLLVAGGVAAILLVSTQTKSAAALAGTWIASILLCTLPAIFLVLFGPIIFAFMFGRGEG